MSKLKIGRWFCQRVDNGKLQRVRVSAKAEAQFPLAYRKLYQQHGAVRLVQQVMADKDMTLAEAWEDVQRMFNDTPK